MKKSLRITLLVALLLVIVGGVTMGIGLTLQSAREQADPYYRITEQTLELDGVESLRIVTAADDVEVRRSADDTATLTAYETKHECYEVKTARSSLTVSYSLLYPRRWYDNMFHFADLSRENCVTLTLPASYTGEVYVETAGGDVTLSQLAASKVRAACASGDISARNLACDEQLSLQAVSGDIYAADCVGESLLYSTTSGDVTLRQMQFASLRGESISGDQEASHCAFGTAELNATSGDVQLERGDCPDLSVSTVSGDVLATVMGTHEDTRIKVETVSGLCNLKDKTNGTRSLQLSTTSGDIRVDFVQP